jgi:kynureninase
VEQAGWENILLKQKKINNYLWFLLEDVYASSSKRIIEFITPQNEEERGCQVSMLMLENGKEIYDQLINQGIMVDWREPNVIRLAPVPLYNTFEEVWRFADALRKLVG